MAIFSSEGMHNELAAIWPEEWRMWNVMTRGYREAADHLAQHAVNTGTHAMDTFVFPIVYLYRHAIELHLKAALHHGRLLYKDATETSLPQTERIHDLERLWLQAKAMFVAIEPDCEDEKMAAAEQVILELHAADLQNTAAGFRYPERTPAGSINLVVLATTLSGVLEYLDAMVYGLDAMTEVRNEAMAEIQQE